MKRAILLLGSNLGNKHLIVHEALNQLSLKCGSIVVKSKNYSSEPWGFEAESHFINMAVEIKTDLEPHVLLEQILKIESEMGRTRVNDGKYHSREIDIDIIFYGNRVIETESLIIPHPKMHLRSFVLLPVNEIAPDFIHPVLKSSVGNILEECTDNSLVKVLS